MKIIEKIPYLYKGLTMSAEISGDRKPAFSYPPEQEETRRAYRGYLLTYNSNKVYSCGFNNFFCICSGKRSEPMSYEKFAFRYKYCSSNKETLLWSIILVIIIVTATIFLTINKVGLL